MAKRAGEWPRSMSALGLCDSAQAQARRKPGLEASDSAGCQVTSLAMSRSLNFWILPVEVFGISVKTT